MSAQEPLGSAAEEALRLLSAAEHWARERAESFTDSEHLATGSPECTVCPVCQAVGALRHVRPETVVHLLDAGASLAAALRTVVRSAAPHPGPTAPAVQRIDLDGTPP